MKKVIGFILFLILLSNSNLNADFLYGWGNNNYGQLGINKNWLPRQIDKDTNWLQVACGGAFTMALAKSSITSVPELSKSNNISLNIKPNPANEEIEIDFNTPDCNKSEICIYSIEGELIDIIKNLNGNSLIYNSSKLAVGAYNVILTCGSEKALQKLVAAR
jgi:alpha-tubulin suppressor-like RCC1 family protein